MVTSSTTTGLLHHLKAAFTTLPLTHDITINIVSSQPRRTNGLYPNTSSAPKVWLEEVLVTVAVAVEDTSGNVESQVEANNDSTSPRILVSALEAFIFTIPSTATTLIYISKVDSTGYTSTTTGPTPNRRQPPFTKTLITAFLSYHISPSTAPTPRVFINLFARSQNQYLFPNSIEGGVKRVVGGAKLCAWWKNVFEDVVLEMKAMEKEEDKEREKELNHPVASTSDKMDATFNATSKPSRLYLNYILPSYDSSEARGLLGLSKKELPSGIEWQYIPPFHPTIPSPLNPEPSLSAHALTIATLIPTFSDDPKARFITEILEEAVVDKSNRRSTRQATNEDSQEDSQSQPSAKRRRLGATSSLSQIKKAKREDADEYRIEAEKMLEKVSYDEFWERMGFRQECASGDVTGFFGMSVLREASSFLIGESDTGEIESKELSDQVDESQDSSVSNKADGTVQYLRSKAFSIPTPVFARITAALLNHDFGSRLLALNASEQFLTSTGNLVDTELGTGTWERICSVVIPHNTTSSAVVIPIPALTAPPVNMLAVKKKKKPVA